MSIVVILLGQYVYKVLVDLLNLILSYNRELYRELIAYPSEIVPVFDLVIHEIINKKYPTVERRQRTQVGTSVCIERYGLFCLGSNVWSGGKHQYEGTQSQWYRQNDINQGHGYSMQPNNSWFACSILSLCFVCPFCGGEMRNARPFALVLTVLQVMIDRGRITEPVQCPRCMTANTMEAVHNRGQFADKQLIKVQETPDSIPEGMANMRLTETLAHEYCMQGRRRTRWTFLLLTILWM